MARRSTGHSGRSSAIGFRLRVNAQYLHRVRSMFLLTGVAGTCSCRAEAVVCQLASYSASRTIVPTMRNIFCGTREGSTDGETKHNVFFATSMHFEHGFEGFRNAYAGAQWCLAHRRVFVISFLSVCVLSVALFTRLLGPGISFRP